MTFQNKTIFITSGNSKDRHCFNSTMAREGAIVIAAKSVEENPRSPGTIYTAAREIRSSQEGKPYLYRVDIRFEEQVVEP